MPSRRETLAILATGLSGVAGCIGSPAAESPLAEASDTPTRTPGPPPGTDPGSPTDHEPTDSTTSTADLDPWEAAWNLTVDYAHVLGLDAAAGRIYATLSGDRGPSAVAAVDPAGPAIEWEAPFEGEAVAGSHAGYRPIARDGWGVTVTEDFVYAVTGRADESEWTALHAVDRVSGEKRWSLRRERELAVHGVVDGLVVASGLEFWQPDTTHDTPEEPLTSVVYGIDAADGSVRWTASFEAVADVAVSPDGVFVAAGRRLVGLGLDGRQRFSSVVSVHGGRAVRAAPGRIYYLPDHGGSAELKGFDPDGDRAWRHSLPVHEVLLDGDRLYAGGEAVVAIEPDGTIAWRDDQGYGQWLLLGPNRETLFTRSGVGQDRATAYRTSDGERRWTYRPPDLSSPNAWPVAATAEIAVVEGITGEHADDPFTSLYAVDRGSGRATRSTSVEPVFEVTSVDGAVVLAGSAIIGLEP